MVLLGASALYFMGNFYLFAITKKNHGVCGDAQLARSLEAMKNQSGTYIRPGKRGWMVWLSERCFFRRDKNNKEQVPARIMARKCTFGELIYNVIVRRDLGAWEGVANQAVGYGMVRQQTYNEIVV